MPFRFCNPAKSTEKGRGIDIQHCECGEWKMKKICKLYYSQRNTPWVEVGMWMCQIVGVTLGDLWEDGQENPSLLSLTLSQGASTLMPSSRRKHGIIFKIKKPHQILLGRFLSLVTNRKPLVMILDPKAPALQHQEIKEMMGIKLSLSVVRKDLTELHIEHTEIVDNKSSARCSVYRLYLDSDLESCVIKCIPC